MPLRAYLPAVGSYLRVFVSNMICLYVCTITFDQITKLCPLSSLLLLINH